MPLDSSQGCHGEIAAYLWGDCGGEMFGVPYQLAQLQQHGLRATFFVDPMFSFALGLPALREIVSLIQSHGQRVELHLHPEWLTDPRCPALPAFKGPLIGEYAQDVQSHLISVARDQLMEAGASPPTAFRAGSWGASSSTLRALARVGIGTDSSLNAHYDDSLADLPGRERMQRVASVHEVTEVPVTRFDDGITRGGRPLSLVGISSAEMRHVLESLERAGEPTAVVVMHSNEFVKTERLWADRPLEPRRLVASRFEKLCRFLAERSERFPTRFITDYAGAVDTLEDSMIVKSSILRTQGRLGRVNTIAVPRRPVRSSERRGT
ncbi:MAG: hypothetical protein WBO04_11005 [Steroidobacteraceae bacterium]